MLHEALKLSAVDFTPQFYSWVWVSVFVAVVQPFCSLFFMIERLFEACIIFKNHALTWRCRLAVFQGCVPPDQFGLALEL